MTPPHARSRAIRRRRRAPRHARPTTPYVTARRGSALRTVIAATTVVASLSVVLPAGAATEYTVAPGDALSIIADRHRVTVQDIVEANGLADPDVIRVGQRLRIPDNAAAPTTGASHVVRPGDSLWAIALRYGVSLSALVTHNRVDDANLILPGQVLTLPGTPPADGEDDTDQGPSAAGAGTAEDDAAAGPDVHVVTAGDTLSAIARTHGVTLAHLLEVNDLDIAAIIVPGQRIRLGQAGGPTEPADRPIDSSKLPADLAGSPDKLALMGAFDRWAAEYGVPPELVKALAWFESGWNNDLESSAGALGIGQVLPITASFVSDVLLGGVPIDLGTPNDNIRASTRYLRYLLDETGDLRLAVASYYQGLTATRRHGIYPSSEFYVDGILSLRERFT